MEPLSPSIIFALVFVVLTGFLAFLLPKKQRCSLPPGPWGVPLLGSLPFLTPDLHRAFAAMAAIYGPVFSLRLGSRLCVVLSSPSAAEEALREHDAVLADRDPPSVARISTYGFSDMLCAPCGPTWRTMRKIAVRELLCPAAVNAAVPLICTEAREAVGELQGSAHKREAVNLREALFNLALKITQGVLCNEQLGEDQSKADEDREIGAVVHGMMELMAKPNLSDFFPLLEALDLQGLDRQMKRWTERYEALFESFRRKAAAARNKRGGGDSTADGKGTLGKSFLEMLLEMVGDDDNSAADPAGRALTMENVRGLLLDMVIGGTDTTSTTTEWALAELVRHPGAMAKAQQELDAVVGIHGLVDGSHLPRLLYLSAVVKETLRLHHIIPLLFPRRAREDCVIGGYTVPKDARVMVNVWAIQRDGSAWPDEPLEFRPERFLAAATGEGHAGRRGFEYLPFGSGRRSCVGIGIAERTVMLVLGSLVHAFEWGVPEGAGDVNLDDEFGLVLKMKEPLVLVPRWRLGDMKEPY